jgi:hypothetical protein
MAMQIKDGTGHGYLALVDERNHLHVSSRNMSLDFCKATDGHMYLMTTGILAVTTTEGLMLWVSYTESNDDLAISNIAIYWNGGDTTGTKCLEAKFKFNDTEPDTNTSSISLYNTNTGSANEVEHSALVWDGTSTGMTGHSGGVTVSNVICCKGRTSLDLGGKFIISPSRNMSVYLKGEEAGNAAVSAFAFKVLDVDRHEHS